MEFMNHDTMSGIGMEYILGMITPKTPYGLDGWRNIKPCSRGEEQRLRAELDITEELIKLLEGFNSEFSEIDFTLGNFKEIRTSLKRVENNMVLDEVELFEIKNFIFNIKDIGMAQDRIHTLPKSLILDRSLELEELFDPEGTDSRTFYVYDCYSGELRDIREEKRELQCLYDREKKRLLKLSEEEIGVSLKLKGEIMIPRSDKSRLDKARECQYICEDSSSMLAVNFKLKGNEEMNRLQHLLEELKLKEEQEEYRIRKNLSLRLKENINVLYGLINKVAYLDLLLSKVEFALKIRGVKPEIHDSMYMEISNGRHVRLEEILKNQGKSFTPVSCSLKQGVTVITGANMGGKTVRLKLIGMLQAIAQLGLFVPAEGFKTCMMDFIYLSIGDRQSMDSGLSTFGGEISGMIDIINSVSSRGLILIDELARGTNPEEGYAISRAIARYLKDKGSITLFITHFSGITEEDGIEHLRVKGLKRMDFEGLKNEIENPVVRMGYVQDYMDYRLERAYGEEDVPKDAINIARLMGMNEEVLGFAEEILCLGRGKN